MTEGIKKEKNKIFSIISFFLSFFTIFVLGFSFGNNLVVYSFLAIAMLFVLAYSLINETGKKDLFYMSIILIPLLVFAILGVVSNFAKYEIGMLNKVFTIFSIVLFLCIGYLLGKKQSIINFKYVLIAFYSGVFLLCLINFIATMVEFYPFYTLVENSKVMYFEGDIVRDDINSIAYGLVGFKCTYIPLTYYSLFPIILLTSSFLFKKEYLKNKYLLFAIIFINLFALICLIFTLSRSLLLPYLLVAFVFIAILFFKFLMKKKMVLNVFILVILALFLIWFILFMILCQGNRPLYDLFTNNGFLKRLFISNKYCLEYRKILYHCFSQDKIFGYPTHTTVGITNYPSGNWFIDLFQYVGPIGVLFFIAFMIIASIFLYRYIFKSKDKNNIKNTVVTLLLVYFAYTFIGGSPMMDSIGSIITPFYMTAPFMFMILCTGYICSNNKEIKHA